jgi:hypothetical protein
MGLDTAAIETQVATDLRLDAPADATDAVNSAIEYITADTGTDNTTWQDTDTLLVKGVTLLAERIYQDTPTPSGSVSQFDDGAFGQSFTPKLLYSHLQEYWRHMFDFQAGAGGFA